MTTDNIIPFPLRVDPSLGPWADDLKDVSQIGIADYATIIDCPFSAVEPDLHQFGGVARAHLYHLAPVDDGNDCLGGLVLEFLVDDYSDWEFEDLVVLATIECFGYAGGWTAISMRDAEGTPLIGRTWHDGYCAISMIFSPDPENRSLAIHIGDALQHPTVQTVDVLDA